MYHRESRELKLMLAVLMLSLVITQVRGQASPEISVGTMTIKPTIDGRWQQGEWDNAVEYTLSGSARSVKFSGYFRMMHDINNLYGIIDVPFDNGTEYLNPNLGFPVGTVFLAFYYGTSYDPKNQTQLHPRISNLHSTRPPNAPLWQWSARHCGSGVARTLTQ